VRARSAELEAASAFDTATSPVPRVENVACAGEDGPVTSAEVVVGGRSFKGYDGGSYLGFAQGFLLYVDGAGQVEVDAYGTALVDAGATPLQSGWITDPFGLTWQIVPRRFTELVADANPRKMQAGMDAMTTMDKLDVAGSERAYEGA
jgi:predicted 3-demethylubiquinone-9 3-methyltransferase (glyoxalase superfamily)